MILTSISRVDLEPPPWLYALMAQGSWFRLVYRRFVADLGASLAGGASLLDVGTGPGYLIRYLADARPDLHLIGLDLSFRMIHRARQAGSTQKAQGGWLVADAAVLPFPDGTFDQVLTTFSFHLWPRPAQGVAEILRVLKPGGRAWIYELNLDAPAAGLREFAREEKLPYPLVHFGFKALSWHHGLQAADFAAVFKQAGVPGWELQPVHHLFWRADFGC